MTTFDSSSPSSPANTVWERECGVEVAKALHRALVVGKGRKLHTPTPIQLRSLQHFCDRTKANDNSNATLLKAPTGTGKTLAYVLPMLRDLMRMGPMPRDASPLAVVVAPTRDLATQIFRDVLDPVVSALKPHWLTCGLLVGGNDRAQEKLRLRKGLHVIVCTPGRLLDHLTATTHVHAERWVQHCRWIVIDEVDRLVDGGFAPKVRQFLSIFADAKERARELVVVSATGLTDTTLEHAEVEAKRKHVLDVLGVPSEHQIAVVQNDAIVSTTVESVEKSSKDPDESPVSFPPSLKQLCWVCPQTKLKLAWLFVKLRTLVHKDGHRRIIVFVSCRDVVDYVTPLARKLVGVRTVGLHAQVEDRQAIVRLFEQSSYPTEKMADDSKIEDNTDKKNDEKKTKTTDLSDCAILFTTDVAARGVDFRDVSVVVQWEPATDRADYVHRVGRCARQGATGTAYIMLLAHEQGYLQLLPPGCDVAITDTMGMAGEEERKAWDMLHRIQDAVEADPEVRERAERAARASLRAYATHGGSERQFFHPRLLHLGHQSGMFGLAYVSNDKKTKGSGKRNDNRGKTNGKDNGKEKHIQRRIQSKSSVHAANAPSTTNANKKRPKASMSEFSAF